MRNLEQPITPAQNALLDFIGNNDAHSLFKHLHLMLGIAMSADPLDANTPTPLAESYFFTHELLGLLHNLSVEPIAGQVVGSAAFHQFQPTSAAVPKRRPNK